ncbi:MAG: hypothetical protein JW976_00720 [Syntrophaceae bacterium]|nr:hypothetical protein [Syntrophaceae bacterium]
MPKTVKETVNLLERDGIQKFRKFLKINRTDSDKRFIMVALYQSSLAMKCFYYNIKSFLAILFSKIVAYKLGVAMMIFIVIWLTLWTRQLKKKQN